MSIAKIINKPTIIHISQEAKRNSVRMYGENLASLMLESIRTVAKEPTKRISNGNKKSLFQRIKNYFRPEKQMIIGVDCNKDGDFIVRSTLNVGNKAFSGKEVPFNLIETLETLKNYRQAIETSKNDLLEKLSRFNLSRK